MSKTLLVAAGLVAGLFAVAPAHAASGIGTTCTPTTTNWSGGGDGTSWDDPGNWDNGVPGACATANLASLSGVTVNYIDSIPTSPPLAGLTVDGGMTLALQPNSSLADDMIVGDASTGTVTNTNATHSVTGNLILGNQPTGVGSYTITGNNAQTNINFVSGGNGLANPPGSNGYVTDNNGNVLGPSPAPNGALIVGQFGIGTFSQGTDPTDNGNQVNVAGDLVIGNQGTNGDIFSSTANSQGTYTLNSGTLTVGGIVAVGGDSTANNQLIQNGGSIVLTSSASGNPDYMSVSAGCYSPTGTCSYPGTFFVGGQSASDYGTGTYTLTAGTLNTPSMAIGYGGTGTVNQSGGQVTTGYLDMGDCGGCNGGNAAGFYNLSGTGTLISNGGESVGDFGHGEFVQGADNLGTTTNTVNGTLSISNGATATPNTANPNNYDRSGTYTLDSGLLSTQYTVVGSQGTGTFIQNGGTHTITNTLTVGQQNSLPLSGPAGSGTPSNPVFGGPAPGVYTMTTGVLTAGGDQSVGSDTSGAGIIIGDAGNGTFNQIGGSVTSGIGGTQRGDLLIGAQAGSTGNYNLGDSTNSAPILQVYGDTIIGRDAAGSVTVPDGMNDGGTVTIPLASANGTLTIAGNGTSMSVSQYTGFDPHNGGNLLVGLNGTGAVSQTDQSTVYTDHYLVLGANAGSTGSYTLSATSIPSGGPNSGYNLFVGSDLDVGGYNPATDIYGYNPQTTATGGTGTFTQNSGDVFVVGAANIGNTGGTGTYTLGTGTFVVGGALNIGNTLNPGDGTSGTLLQSGGITTVLGAGVFVGEGGVGQYNLSSGTLNVLTGQNGLPTTFTVGDTSQGTVNQTGGTVLAGLAAPGASYSGLSNPANGVFNLNIGNQAGPGFYNLSSTDQASPASLQVSGNLNLGVNGGSSGNLTIGTSGFVGNDATSLTVSPDQVNGNNGGNILVGVNGTGIVTQYSGSVSASNDVALGVNSGSTGTYTLDNGSLTTPQLEIGGSSTFQTSINGGTGLFIQNGGSVDVPDTSGNSILSIGNFGGSGEYDLNNGTLNVTVESYVNSGSFKQGGGSFTTGYLNVGIGGGESATYTMTGGNLTVAGDLGVGGPNGQGSFTQSAGTTVQVDGGLYVNNDNTSTTTGGSYAISGGSLNVNGTAFVGNNGGTATATGGGFNQSGNSSVTVGGSLIVGNDGGSNGLYTLTGGTLTTGTTAANVNNLGDVIIGLNGTGELDNSGGTQISSSNDGLTLGFFGGSQGTYKLTGTGSLSVAGNENVGVFGTGTFLQGDGAGNTSNTVAGSLYISSGFGGPASSYTLTDGTLTVTGSEIVGFAAQGSFTQSGGTNNANGGLIVGLLSNAADATQFGNGTYTLGGTGVLNSQGALVIGAQNGSTGLFTLQSGGTVNVGVTGAASFMDVAESGTGTYTQTGGTTTIIGALDIGRCGSAATATCNNGSNPYTGAAGNGTVNLSGGSMSVQFDSTSNYGGFAKVGDAGSGTLNISGGASFTSNSLDLGTDGGTGIVTLNGSASSVTLQNLGVGDNGQGTFTQNDGTVRISGALGIGNSAAQNDGFANLPAGNGEYDLNGGSLTVGGEYIGEAGTGTLKQTGGLNTASSVSIGNNTGGVGIYDLSGTGTLTDSGALYVGSAGNGTLNQSGGTATATGLSVGNDAGGVGNYNLSGGSLTINGTTYVGGVATAQGTVTQTGGTAALNGNVNVGYAAGAAGTYALGGSGVATIGGNLDIGVAAASNGTFNFNTATGDHATLSFLTSGSTMTVGDAGTGTVNQGGGDLNLANQGVTLEIGAQAGSYGHYNMSGGTLEDDLVVGDAGTGTFSNTGGGHTVNGNLIIGNQPTGTGTYTLGGTGSLTLNTAGAQIILGNQSNTTNAASGTFNFNTAAGDNGTIAFNAGTSQSIIVGNSGSGVFNQGGGDLNTRDSGVGLDIAANANSFGQYNMSGGTLETLSLNVGDGGSGQFNLSGGSVTIGSSTIAANLVIGNQAGSTGVVSLYGANPGLTVWGDATVGNNGYAQFNQDTGVADIKGSMTIAATGAGGAAAIEGGSLTVGDGGAGNQLLITSNGSMKIEDNGTNGAQVTVDGTLVNNGQLALGLHDVAGTPATLTATTFQNNGGFNFEGNSVLNANVTNGGTTNTLASFSAQNGSNTQVQLNGNMSNYASVNVSELGLTAPTFTQNGTFTNNAGGTFAVTDGQVTINGGSSDSLDNAGTVTFRNDPNSGTAPPYAASIVALNGNVTNTGSGQFTVQGSQVTITGALQNDATLNVGTGSNGQGSTFKVTGTTVNNGTVNATGSTLYFTDFTNNGAYISDPSANHFVDLTVSSTGYLSGGAGNVFDITGNFHNASTQASLWNTTGATLEFSSGTSTSHTMDLVGIDDGAYSSGFNNNFAWGVLDIDPGNALSLAPTVGTNALYASMLDGLTFAGDLVTDIFGNGLNIYYDPSVDTALNDQTYNLENGGLLCAVGSTCSVTPPTPGVPEPGSLLLLGGGLAGLAFMRRRMAGSGKQAAGR